MTDRRPAGDTVGETSAYGTRPWVAQYPAGIPANIDIPEISLVDVQRATAQRYPDLVAAVFYGREFTFREIAEQSNRFAHALRSMGHEPGQPVLVILPNVPQFLVVAYGILKAGGIIAAINPLLTPREIGQLANDSGARIVVTLDRFWSDVEPLLESGELKAAIVTGVQDGLPWLKRLLYPLKYRKEMVKVRHEPERRRFQYTKLLSPAPVDDPGIEIDPEQPALLQYTGGTTGLPKAAVLSHRNLVANSLQIRHWIVDLEEGREVLMAILPFFHAYGGTLCLFLATQAAAKLVLVPRFEIKDVMNLIRKHQPTILPGVPTLYNALNRAAANDPDRQRALRSIRYCVSGGAPLPAEVQMRFEAVTGGRLVEGYGLSEASPVTHVNPLDGRARLGTIGLPVSSTESRIVDPETHEPAPLGERGELAIRGPQIMQGYWKRPEEAAQVLDGDGWLYTGDIATMDDDGFFRIVDRLKDVIITGGENIYPREIEDVLFQHPKIQEVSVAAIPHTAGGEIAKAYIVLEPGEQMDRAEVIRYCSEHLAKYKIPRQIEFREELPKSAAGKILRRVLQDEERVGAET